MVAGLGGPGASEARQQAPGPTFVESWHETLAVNMAAGYTLMTGRPQAVLLHAGVGMLQGSMGIHGALQNEVPMVVMSGESRRLGEDPDLDIEQQWYGGLTVGGIERFVEPVAKWARAVTSPYTLYESVIRAGEMAQRVPKGPIYLNVALEHMLHDWTPPRARARGAAGADLQPRSAGHRQGRRSFCATPRARSSSRRLPGAIPRHSPRWWSSPTFSPSR